MKTLEVPIIFKTYELYKSLQGYQKNIPKSERYTIWQKIQTCNLDTLELLIRVGYLTPIEKLSTLIKVSANVDLLRILLRLTYETKVIPSKNYLEYQTILDEIGRMLGGWIKNLRLNLAERK